jgi:acyl-CoA synthetase (AMP-forming)/AMP-acid ligase II
MIFPNRSSHETVARLFEARAAHPHDVHRSMLRYGDHAFSYGEANRCVNRVAHAYHALGLRKGDVVALIMENRPEYLWHYLAGGKLGVVMALINPNARAGGLIHAIRTATPSRIIVGSEVWPRLAEIRSDLPPALVQGIHVDIDPDSAAIPPPATRFDELVASASDENPAWAERPRLSDMGAYIYTSGTTGMPKAANMSYFRLTNVSRVLGALAWRTRPDDVIYCCLPLYHSNALLVAAGSTITHGATFALARRFSARHFWADIARHRATGFNYIGEMCRYLVNTPPSETELEHGVHTVVGQGLRGDIWRAFQARFRIERIVEFYASTEGNIATINLGDTVGSVGKLLFGGALVRWDGDQGDFERRPNGRLIRCCVGESGVLLGRIHRRTPFEGYRDRGATAAKVVRDAFTCGDAWYNTGDLFCMDRRRNLTFIDRVGDTYRWKGENVATTDVQEQIGKWNPVALVNVYGVKVDRAEGRAGMASLVMRPSAIFDPLALAQHVDATLPPCSRPVFVRLHGMLETTETLKLMKEKLRVDGFNPASCKDPLYFRAAGMPSYEKLTPAQYEHVVSGRLRL